MKWRTIVREVTMEDEIEDRVVQTVLVVTQTQQVATGSRTDCAVCCVKPQDTAAGYTMRKTPTHDPSHILTSNIQV